MSRYEKKLLLVEKLTEKGHKRVLNSHIRKTASDVGLSFESAKRAWDNFVEFGIVDRRGVNVSNDKKDVHDTVKKINSMKANKKFTYNKRVKVLRDYFSGTSTVLEILTKHKISKEQLYNTIHDLNVSGKVGNKVILDWTKYRKIDVKKVMRYNKFPTRFSGTKNEELTIKRLSTVLDKYLSVGK